MGGQRVRNRFSISWSQTLVSDRFRVIRTENLPAYIQGSGAMCASAHLADTFPRPLIGRFPSAAPRRLLDPYSVTALLLHALFV